MKKFLLLLLSVGMLLGCKKKSITQNCCISPPFQQAFSGGYIYMPNIFTPDSDGLNDVFEPIGSGIDSYALEIVSTKKTLFKGGENEPWDGKHNGSTVRDIVGWKLNILTSNAEEYSYSGQVCALVIANGICPKHIEDCFFASQFSVSQQTFDPDISSGELFCE